MSWFYIIFEVWYLFKKKKGLWYTVSPFPISPPRCVVFSPDGICLYSGSDDTLRVYGWEPDCCFDVVHVGWGKVVDFAICSNQMVSNALLFYYCFVSVNIFNKVYIQVLSRPWDGVSMFIILWYFINVYLKKVWTVSKFIRYWNFKGWSFKAVQLSVCLDQINEYKDEFWQF